MTILINVENKIAFLKAVTKNRNYLNVLIFKDFINYIYIILEKEKFFLNSQKIDFCNLHFYLNSYI